LAEHLNADQIRVSMRGNLLNGREVNGRTLSRRVSFAFITSKSTSDKHTVGTMSGRLRPDLLMVYYTSELIKQKLNSLDPEGVPSEDDDSESTDNDLNPDDNGDDDDQYHRGRQLLWSPDSSNSSLSDAEERRQLLAYMHRRRAGLLEPLKDGKPFSTTVLYWRGLADHEGVAESLPIITASIRICPQ
jgi:hypothetical protein